MQSVMTVVIPALYAIVVVLILFVDPPSDGWLVRTWNWISGLFSRRKA